MPHVRAGRPEVPWYRIHSDEAVPNRKPQAANSIKGELVVIVLH